MKTLRDFKFSILGGENVVSEPKQIMFYARASYLNEQKSVTFGNRLPGISGSGELQNNRTSQNLSVWRQVGWEVRASEEALDSRKSGQMNKSLLEVKK